MAHSGTDRAGDGLLEPEHDDSALFPLPPLLLLPFLLDGRELTVWSTSPQLAILRKYGGSLNAAVSLVVLIGLQTCHLRFFSAGIVYSYN